MSERSSQFDGSIPDIYDQHLGPMFFHGYAADLAARVSVDDGARVLELAGGTGISGRHLRDALPASATLVLSDLNPPMLEVAERKFEPHENVEFQPADGTALPFGDAEFDAATCQFGVMFFPDKAVAFTEVARVLKSGGRFAFNVWDALEHNPIPAVVGPAIMKFLPDTYDNFFDIPFGFHDHGAIRGLLEDAGFRDIAFEVCARDLTSESAAHAAIGFVEGNPTILNIRDNPEVEVSDVIEAVAAELRTVGGDNPLRSTMQAVVITADLPG